MKYEVEYRATTKREDFVSLLLKTYKDIKPQTALRRWYDLQKASKDYLEAIGPKSIKPNNLKMLTIKDMKKYNYKLTDNTLRKHGFKYEEIKWLKINGWL